MSGAAGARLAAHRRPALKHFPEKLIDFSINKMR